MLQRRATLEESKLWPRNQIITDESRVPCIPRFFWLEARQHFESGYPVSAILMSGLAVESGVTEYASQWMHKAFEIELSEAVKILECTMFRRIVGLLCRKEELAKDLRNDLYEIYDKRNEFVHVQTSQILGSFGEEKLEVKDGTGKVLTRMKVKDDDLFKAVGVQMNAEDEARKTLQLTEQCILRLFDIDRYWKRFLWNENPSSRPTKVDSEKEAHNP